MAFQVRSLVTLTASATGTRRRGMQAHAAYMQPVAANAHGFLMKDLARDGGANHCRLFEATLQPADEVEAVPAVGKWPLSLSITTVLELPSCLAL